MAKISAVLFDYGLVLTDQPDPAAWAHMQQILQTDEAAFHPAYWNPRHSYDRGDLNSQAYWNTVAEAVGRVLTAEQRHELIEADACMWTRPNQQMIDWAARLQAAGFRTGILSNLGDAMEQGVRARCPWLEDFAHHTFSHRLGIAKPEPEIYRHAAEGLGVPIDEVLFVDDREDNIEAARAVGMQAIRYLNYDAFLREMQSRGFDWLLTLSPMAS